LGFIFYSKQNLSAVGIQVEFYSEDKVFMNKNTLEAGVVILLIKCGHGFKVLEDLLMLEVKQDPYAEDKCKIKFNPA
jgi:hypothetical protein